jgi:hypothetical protein
LSQTSGYGQMLNPAAFAAVSGAGRSVDVARRGTERGSPLAGPRGLAVEQRVPLADQEALQSGEEAKAVPTQQLGDAVLARPVKAGTR